MNALDLHVRLAGSLLLILSFGHVYIARYFHWREESRRLSAFNGQAFLVHAFFIALMVGFVGILALAWPRALTTPNILGIPITGGLTLLWAIRLYCQWFVYDRALWRGKRFESVFQILFTLLWLYLIVVFAACLRLQLGLSL